MKPGVEAAVWALLLIGCEGTALGPPAPPPEPGEAPPEEPELPWYASGRCAREEPWESVIELQPDRPRVHVIGASRALDGVVAVDLDLDQPAALVLSSSSPFTWRLALSSRTMLTTLLLLGPADVESVVGVPWVIREDSPSCAWAYRDARCPVAAALDRIEAALHDPMQSLDGCPTLGAVALVGATSPVRWDPGSTAPELIIDSDGRRVRAPAGAAGGRVWASHPHGAGRYYFELEVEGGPGTSLGLGVRAGGFECQWALDGGFGCPGVTAVGPVLSPGDRAGVAVDLDGARLHLSLNGAWWTGDPTQDPGLILPAWVGRAGVTPLVVLGSGGQATGAFAVEDQRSPAPAGYGEWRRRR